MICKLIICKNFRGRSPRCQRPFSKVEGSIGGPEADERLALNPNTPKAVLSELFLKHPLAMLENPILSYQVFADYKPLHELLSASQKLALCAALRRAGRETELESLLPLRERREWLASDGDLGLLDPAHLAEICRWLAAAVSDSMSIPTGRPSMMARRPI